MNIFSIVIGLIPTVISTVLVFYIQRFLKKRDEEAVHHAADRKKESILSMDLLWSVANLTYTNTMLIQRKETNGELSEGIDSFKKAKGDYNKFINEKAQDHLQEK